MNEIHSFEIKIHTLSKDEFVQYIEKSISFGNKLVQSGVNASSIVELKHNKELVKAYNNADLVNIDGMSIVWALRLLGFNVRERVACPDLANGVMEMAQLRSYKIFLFGAEEKSIKAAVENLKRTYPSLIIAGFRNGFYRQDEEEQIVKMINTSQAEILFMGMPSPRKEFFVEKYNSQLNVKYILGVGGFFDILAGSINRAPLWMQNLGLEWFYRFLQEPKRLSKRYFIGNLKFIRLVFIEKFKKCPL